MSSIPSDLHSDVVKRARGRCEYCQLSQVGQEATFHVDHVKPRASGGATDLNNLALACISCSLRKWAKESAIDPQSGNEARLFNPRTQIWSDHFSWSNEVVVPKTGIGRATVAALSMNRPLIKTIRREEAVRGRHPPEE